MGFFAWRQASQDGWLQAAHSKASHAPSTIHHPTESAMPFSRRRNRHAPKVGRQANIA